MSEQEISREHSDDRGSPQGPIEISEVPGTEVRDLGSAHSPGPASGNNHNDPDFSRRGTSVDELSVNRD